MARLRQQHPQNYVNSGNIHTDFENIIRYLNTAERGNKTLAELFAVLFDERGQFRGPIEFRVDPVTGFQYRVGEYRDAEDGWEDLLDIASLRGPSGSSVGFVEGPFFFNKVTRVITTGINTVTVTNGGAGYLNPPPVVFSPPQDSTGSRPTAVAVVENGEVTAINITSPGIGYITTPTASIGPPTQAGGVQATATTDLAPLTAQSRSIQYGFDFSVADIVVYKNGILLGEETVAGDPPDYTYDKDTNTVVIADPPGVQLADKITIYSVRSQSVTNFRRQDTIISGNTSIIPFIHTADERLLVWRNGVLQEEGGNADYLASPISDTITFLDPQGLSNNDKITVMTVENLSLKTVAGLMFEDTYTDGNGFIRWAKLAVQEDEIPLSKVNSLAPTLAAKANITIANTTPQQPTTGDLWLDIARVPAILKFYDGTQWLETSPESSLPTFIQSNAGQYVRVNGTGTALEYGNIDFSALVPKTFMGASNGVASLDTDGKLPVSQLPEIFSTQTISLFSPWEDNAATVTNKTYFVGMIWKQKLRIDGITHKLGAGTCTIQVSVDGVTVGSPFPVTSTRASVNMPSVIEIDGTITGRRLELVVTNASAAATLDVGLACATLNL
jgi:hypothetical protein